MHKARAFFFVCAGLPCLALAYHLGARSAGAQVGGAVECVGAEGDNGSAVVNHHLYVANDCLAPSLVDYGEIPSSARAIACGGGALVLEDGTVYVYRSIGWQRQGGILPITGSTPAVRQSVGQLKAKYATPAARGKQRPGRPGTVTSGRRAIGFPGSGVMGLLVVANSGRTTATALWPTPR